MESLRFVMGRYGFVSDLFANVDGLSGIGKNRYRLFRDRFESLWPNSWAIMELLRIVIGSLKSVMGSLLVVKGRYGIF